MPSDLAYENKYLVNSLGHRHWNCVRLLRACGVGGGCYRRWTGLRAGARDCGAAAVPAAGGLLSAAAGLPAAGGLCARRPRVGVLPSGLG
jgi:hypothetical protein